MTYRYTKLDDGEGPDGGARYEIDEVHGFTVCVVDDEETARLFCAAPDMLAALEQALEALNIAPRFRVRGLDSDSYKIATVCEAAINRAKGRG